MLRKKNILYYKIIKEYCDEACSGTNSQRPAFQEMLDDAKKKLFDVVVFLAEFEARPQPYVSRNQVKAVIESDHEAIKTKSADNLRALIDKFINNVTIFKDEIVIEFKANAFGLNGAPGKNRTYAPGSGGRCSIH